MEKVLAALRAVPLFAGLDDRSLQAVSILAREITTHADEVLILEGEPGDAFFVILDGTVRVERGDRTVRSLTAGAFLGEIALVEHGKRTATATCVTRCRLLEIRRHEFERLMDSMPEISRRVRSAIDRRGRE